MTKRRFEKNLVVLLFVGVLVVFSFAQRDSKKMERLYHSAKLLKKSKPADVASGPLKPIGNKQ